MEKKNTHATLVEMWTDAASMENSIEVRQKIKNRTTIWSSNSTSSYISKVNSNTNSKKIYALTMFNAVVFTIAMTWNQN